MSQENSGSEEKGDHEPADFNLTAGRNDQEDLEPPDSKKFQLEIDRLTGLIRKGEIKLKSLEKLVSREMEKTPTRDSKELKAELDSLRTQREQEILARKQHDLDLKGLNMQVLKKNDTCTKLQAGLRYKSESRIDEAVRRLEHQMQVQQLKLSEEKRIVAEIDLLRRTKRNLSEYLVVKQDVEQLRRKQKISRMQRDACVRRITALKSKEEEIKTLESEVVKESDKTKSEQAQLLNDIEVLKKEISELQNRKKSMKVNFAKERSEYYSAIKEAKKQQREVSTKKMSNERQLLLKQVRARKEPFEAEKALCDTLISHMERLHSGGIHLSDSQDAQRPPAAPDKDQSRVAFLPGFEDSSPSGGVFLRRKSASDDLVGIYAGCGKMSRRGSRKGRRSSAKEVPRKLNLHPQVVEHLLSLGLSPPSTGADIPKVLQELQDKKDFFDAAKSPNARHGQSVVYMSPITEESPPEFPGRCETCSDYKDSSSYEKEENVSNDLDVQRDASETKRPNTNDLALSGTSDESRKVFTNEVSNKSYPSNRAVCNGMKPEERDENRAASLELNGVPTVESCLPYDNYTTMYPAKLTTESTILANGSQSDNERTDETVANKEYIGSTEDNNHGSKDVDSKTICNSVLQTDGFCFPGFLNQEAPSVGEKYPA